MQHSTVSIKCNGIFYLAKGFKGCWRGILILGGLFEASLDWQGRYIIHTANNHNREEWAMFQMSIMIHLYYSDILKLRSLAPSSSWSIKLQSIFFWGWTESPKIHWPSDDIIVLIDTCMDHRTCLPWTCFNCKQFWSRNYWFVSRVKDCWRGTLGSRGFAPTALDSEISYNGPHQCFNEM